MTRKLIAILVAAAFGAGFLAPAASAESLWVEPTGASFGNIPGLGVKQTPAKNKKSKKGKGENLRVEKTGVTVSSLSPDDFPPVPGAPIRPASLRSLTIYAG